MLHQGGEEDPQLPVSTLSPGLGLIRYPEREATSWKKRGEKAFEYLVWEDNGWPMKRRREETKRWRVLPLFFFLSFLSLALSLVWTKRRSFDPNIVSGSSFEITTEFIFFDYHRVPLTPTSLFVFKKKIKKREKNFTISYTGNLW